MKGYLMNEDELAPSLLNLGGHRIELVAGPLCGAEVVWTDNVARNKFHYIYGWATYEYEGQGKALYIGG